MKVDIIIRFSKYLSYTSYPIYWRAKLNSFLSSLFWIHFWKVCLNYIFCTKCQHFGPSPCGCWKCESFFSAIFISHRQSCGISYIQKTKQKTFCTTLQKYDQQIVAVKTSQSNVRWPMTKEIVVKKTKYWAIEEGILLVLYEPNYEKISHIRYFRRPYRL